jgi:ubiquinone/menaquinone biosynthesis C-methylase UbiE
MEITLSPEERAEIAAVLPGCRVRMFGGEKGELVSTTVDEFGKALHKWQEENTMPWGRLRYHSTWRNIAKHAEGRPLRILDIGGGDGIDAIHYASLGHQRAPHR